jgi:hypothetical protein
VWHRHAPRFQAPPREYVEVTEAPAILAILDSIVDKYAAA